MKSKVLMVTPMDTMNVQREFDNGLSALAIGCIITGCALLASGCAVHYYDKDSGTEHLWGFGHMRMKAEPSSDTVRTIVNGTQLFGLHIGAGQEEYYLGAGWDNRRKITVADNASVSLEWPNSSFFNVRVGSEPPFLTNYSPTPKNEKEAK